MPGVPSLIKNVIPPAGDLLLVTDTGETHLVLAIKVDENPGNPTLTYFCHEAIFDSDDAVLVMPLQEFSNHAQQWVRAQMQRWATLHDLPSPPPLPT